MALPATLKLDGKSYDVLECEYEFTQPIDSNGKPSGNPRGGLIHFTINAPDENNTIFHEWMLNKSEMKQGIFTFPVTVGTDHLRKVLIFQYAHCIHLYEYFNSQNSVQMYMKITLSAAIISFGKEGTVYTNKELPTG